MNWPFPTKENPPVPWTAKQIKEDQAKQRQQVPDAPF